MADACREAVADACREPVADACREAATAPLLIEYVQHLQNVYWVHTSILVVIA